MVVVCVYNKGVAVILHIQSMSLLSARCTILAPIYCFLYFKPVLYRSGYIFRTATDEPKCPWDPSLGVSDHRQAVHYEPVRGGLSIWAYYGQLEQGPVRPVDLFEAFFCKCGDRLKILPVRENGNSLPLGTMMLLTSQKNGRKDLYSTSP